MKRLAISFIFMALGCAICAATAQFTPLPSNTEITPPAPDLPKNIAGFSGTWYGIWDNGNQTTLVVEKIEPAAAIAVYSWGAYGDNEGGWRRYEWKVEPGRLELNTDGMNIKYFLSGDCEELEGEFRAPSRSQINYVIMQRQPPLAPITTSATATPTPMPANVKITPPAPGISPDIAAFSGSWQGTWSNGRSTVLVVERIEPRTDHIEAIAVYSWGPLKKIEPSGWRRYIGKIEPGKLELSVPRTTIIVTYLLSEDGQTLEGTWRQGLLKLKATMQRQ